MKNINFNSRDTVFDADIVLINPIDLRSVWEPYVAQYIDGSRAIPREKSGGVKSIFEWRRDQISKILYEGKIVFAFLSRRESCLYHENSRIHPREGVITNYSWCPEHDDFWTEMINGEGDKLILSNSKHWMASFYHAFKDILYYQACLKSVNNVFVTNGANLAVGFESIYNKGHLVFLPTFKKSPPSDKLIGVLIQCASKILGEKIATSPPDWVASFKLPGEDQQLTKIADCTTKIMEINQDKEAQEKNLEEIIEFKRLLYEQGNLLGHIVIKSLRKLGFDAKSFKQDDMEHDIIFTSSEGRGLAEVEGKDKKAIDIDKFRQLNTNIDEDFDNQGENAEYAHGVLIGNAYRFQEPSKRTPQQFTDKVVKDAKRKQFALLTTMELYRAIEYIFSHPDDEDFKKKCRETIFATKGAEIKFPIPE